LPNRQPVVNVSWEDAARGGKDDTAYPWGSAIGEGNANCADFFRKNGSLNAAAPVGSFPATGFGLYDMSGNVHEWCQDVHAKYPAEPVRNPEGSPVGTNRVLRGGSWFSFAQFVRSASRYSYPPVGGSSHFGFRLAQGQ
jgi:formylglycine-generating enzyme required for sulfatase activity